MLDIKYIRENAEAVKVRLATRGTDYSASVSYTHLTLPTTSRV